MKVRTENMTYPFDLQKCDCGSMPKVMMARGGEDTMETWVECPSCGMTTDYIEGAYSDPDTAKWLWNDGERSLPPSPTPEDREGASTSTEDA
jgi:hypothetical protein